MLATLLDRTEFESFGFAVFDPKFSGGLYRNAAAGLGVNALFDLVPGSDGPSVSLFLCAKGL
jgi:hypothetical protein